jgi:hypothetical protein
MDALYGFHENPSMGRYTFPAFNKAPAALRGPMAPGQVIECWRLELVTDLFVAMATAIAHRGRRMAGRGKREVRIRVVDPMNPDRGTGAVVRSPDQ